MIYAHICTIYGKQEQMGQKEKTKKGQQQHPLTCNP